MKQRLPIGIQNLREMREEGYYYVDKTHFVARLAKEGKYFFLARPRRFGKSLFVDTLAMAFSGRRELFDGLYLAGHWDWGRVHPVVRLDLSEGGVENREGLRRRLIKHLKENAERLGVGCDDTDDPSACLSDLIARAARHYGERVVVLVDEYDKPLLDHLMEIEIARPLREELRSLYSVFKARDAELRLVFLTGVSKFSKVSIFSGLNQLIDLTLDREFAEVCGYTEEELTTVFAPELAGLDLTEIRHWYNGYAWGGTSLYNPFDVLLFFRHRTLQNYWFETGTPTSLVEWLKRRRYFTPRLEATYATEQLLSAFDVERIEPEAMLWQTGYLTIAGSRRVGGVTEYRLQVPNLEVRQALNEALLIAWHPQGSEVLSQRLPLWEALRQGDALALKGCFDRLFAGIPYQWHVGNDLAASEGYWASLFYSFLASLGIMVEGEVMTDRGRIDLVVRLEGVVWIFEFKVVDDAPTGEALAQIKAKDYSAKYRAPGIKLIEVGVEFGRTQGAIVAWDLG